MRKLELFKTFTSSKRYSIYHGVDQGEGIIKTERIKHSTKDGIEKIPVMNSIHFFIKTKHEDFQKIFDVLIKIIKFDFGLPIISDSSKDDLKIFNVGNLPLEKFADQAYNMRGLQFAIVTGKGTLEEMKAKIDQYILQKYNQHHADLYEFPKLSQNRQAKAQFWKLHVSEGAPQIN